MKTAYIPYGSKLISRELDGLGLGFANFGLNRIAAAMQLSDALKCSSMEVVLDAPGTGWDAKWNPESCAVKGWLVRVY